VRQNWTPRLVLQIFLFVIGFIWFCRLIAVATLELVRVRNAACGATSSRDHSWSIEQAGCLRLLHLLLFVLAREHYGEDVPYGLVIYADETVRKVIPTPENLAWFAEVVQQVRWARGMEQIDRSHQQRSRCRGCGLKPNCDQSLEC